MSDVLETYSPDLDRELCADAHLVDLGDVPLDGCAMDEALDRIATAMAYAAANARLGVMLGGEHTGSLGGFRGIKRVHPDAFLVQADAHLDIRDSYDGEPFTHASWLYHAGQEFGFDHIAQVGLRSGHRTEWRTSRERTAFSSMGLTLPPLLREQLADRPIYLTIDIDVLDPAHAPGTGCPEPGGVTFRDLAAFLHSLAGLRLVGLDVMEVSPNLDPANITASAAAKLVRDAILLAAAPPAAQ
jgi:agmatinase